MEYNEKKMYKWNPKDTFEFDGDQFGRILHSFREILSTPEAQVILRANEANKIMEEKMKEYVEKGVIKEQQEELPKGAKMSIVKK